MDKLRAMRYFCRVVEAKSFSAAAQSLGVVPSALSKVIAALERDLGFLLMNRSTRRLSLTESGEVYYGQCKQILHDLESAEAQGRGDMALLRGTLRFGMHPALRHLVLASLGAFLDDQPDIKIETVITNSPAAVLDEGLDLVLHVGPLSDSALYARHIGWTHPVVCASVGYLAIWGEPTHPSQLARHRAVIFARRDEESNNRWTFVKGEEVCDVELPVCTLVRDGIGLVDAALGGCGLARPNDVAVRHWIATGQLRAVLTDWQGDQKAIYAVMPAHKRSSPAKTQLFVEFVATLLKPRT